MHDPVETIKEPQQNLPTAALVSLGCAKNTVDSEYILGKIRDARILITSDPASADVIIVNTCGFLDEARKEAVETVQEMAGYRQRGRLRRIIVTGCMAERDQSLFHSVMDLSVDCFMSPFSLDSIVDLIHGTVYPAGENAEPLHLHPYLATRRVRVTPASYAYIKVADGCSNRCAYCRIPYLRGEYRSKPIEDVVEEARGLITDGVREINLISQDTASYGCERSGLPRLGDLIDRLVELDGLDWLRILYSHPFHLTDDILERFAEIGSLCNYLDIPIQHVNQTVLKSMNRPGSPRSVRRIFERIRDRVSGITIRTTVMTGYPGETRRAYTELRRFVEEGWVDHLGVFCFSPEPDTTARYLQDRISQEVAMERRDELLSIQQAIVLKKNQSMIGSMRVILVDETNESEGSIGRMESQAPEVDSVVHLDQEIPVGSFVAAQIRDVEPYDLFATVR